MKALKKFKNLISRLEDIYPVYEARSIALYVFENMLNIDKTKLFLNEVPEFTLEDEKKLEKIFMQLKKGMPVQYIQGECTFLNLKLKLNQNVLIPRPETEELVSYVLENTHISKPQVLDVGTGSGCIAIAISKGLSGSKVTAIDISAEALKIAVLNAETNNADIQFIKMDMKDLNQINMKFDVVISNPPYVSYQEKLMMHKNVTEYEPALALFVPDNDPLYFYKQIVIAASDILKTGGTLYFEINENTANEVSKLLKQNSFNNVIIKKDMHGKERIIKANLNFN